MYLDQYFHVSSRSCVYMYVYKCLCVCTQALRSFDARAKDIHTNIRPGLFAQSTPDFIHLFGAQPNLT